MRQLDRDPFGRQTLERETVPTHERGACKWCGQPAKYRYSWTPDDTRFVIRDSSLFCSVDCYRTYSR